MNKVVLGLLIGLGGVAIYEGAIQLREFQERHSYYNWAREYCNHVGKPLLRVGMRRGFTEPPNGDSTIDIDLAVLNIPGGVHGDERDMPFADKQFGVCFNEHTLEHLKSAADVEKAIHECRRVADYAVLLAPSPNSIYASIFCPTHMLRLWLDKENNIITVRPNTWNRGWGYKFESDTGGLGKAIGQSIVSYDPLSLPLVIEGE